jgi:hypothetical protein
MSIKYKMLQHFPAFLVIFSQHFTIIATFLKVLKKTHRIRLAKPTTGAQAHVPRGEAGELPTMSHKLLADSDE